MAKLLIFGAGDIARLAQYYFTRDSEHEVVAFVVDAGFRDVETLGGLPVMLLEEAQERFPPAECQMFVALSYARMNRTRAEKYHSLKSLGYTLVSYISSRCSWLTDATAGDNCFVLEDNTVQPFVRIGNNVTLWSGNHIGHDSIIEDHCFISSHVVVSGHVRIGEYSFIGVNATLRNSITIAPRTLVGAGAVIVKSTEAGGVYVGRPAQALEKSSDDIEP